MKICITGASGLLGTDLVRRFRNEHEVVGTYCHRQVDPDFVQLNLLDPIQTQNVIGDIQPDLVVNTVALTNVDQCDQNMDEAYQQNVQSVANLVQAMNGSGKLVMISTDQVYNSARSKESDIRPINAYGLTKLLGEHAALEHPDGVVLRTNFYGWGENKKSFSDWLLTTIEAQDPLILFDDIFFSPLSLSQLAEVILAVGSQPLRGIFNAGCEERISKAEFGLQLAKQFGLDASYATVGSATDVKLVAPRPTDMSMDSSELYSALNLDQPYSLKTGLTQLYSERKVVQS